MFNPLFLVHYNSSQNNFDQFDVTAMELGLSGFLNGKNTQQNCLGADKNLQINNILLFLFDSKNRIFLEWIKFVNYKSKECDSRAVAANVWFLPTLVLCPRPMGGPLWSLFNF